MRKLKEWLLIITIFMLPALAEGLINIMSEEFIATFVDTVLKIIVAGAVIILWEVRKYEKKSR
jgi:hypothetical protein